MANSLKAYANFFKGWQKSNGAKPTAAQLAVAEKFTRPGKKVTLALAMYLRPQGATQGQIVTACGGPQLNVLRGLVTAGKVKRVDMPDNAAGHTVYRMALKGKAKAHKAVKVKAKGDTKAKAVKPASVEPTAKAA